MSYIFRKVKSKFDDDSKGYWYFIAKNETQLREHWEKYAGNDIKKGVHELADRLSGEFRSHWTSNFASLVAMKSELYNQAYITQAILLENELFQNRLNDLKENGEVWLSNTLTVFGYTPKLHIIIEEIESDKLVYPDEIKPTIDDVRYIMWNGGKHWYAKLGNIDIVDENGNQKWNTKEEAEEAAKNYLKKI